ncbi:flavin reductase family protein [Alienimonas sp. DA493]|uniref:flavin reductase family protein n=1 Tax=Alienimonas sp. DA493 TaxID=3373605 RepID=UPI003754EFBF
MTSPAQPAADDPSPEGFPSSESGPTVAFDPRSLSAEEVYALLTHAVAPRPIAWVSTLSGDGRPNLAPYSYFNVGGQNPPSVVFSPNGGGGGREKDTLRNIRETGEYVINLASRAQAAAMNATAADLPHGQSEWDAAGLSPRPSAVVRPGRVAGSPFALECRLFQIVSHGSGAGAANYVIGEVVHAHVDRSLLNAAGELTSLDSRACGGLGRLGGDWYVDGRGDALFQLDRPG